MDFSRLNIILRTYQETCIKEIEWTFTKEDRQFIHLPTGAGKTITFLSYAKLCHKKVLIIVPSKSLLNQVYDCALKFYDKDDLSRKGSIYTDVCSKIHICIINSISSKYLLYLIKQGFDLIIIDECHHSQSKSYIKVIDSFPNTKILGCTATLDRLDGKLISDILNTCSFSMTIQKMINNKYLSEIEGYRISSGIDLKEIHSHNGDFSISQLYKKLCNEFRNNMILDICKKEMMERKCIVFCINIDHSKKICDLLNSNDIASAHIDGSMNVNQRESILYSFRNGEIKFLCNCQLLCEGFDEPSIDGIVLARPTVSKSLFLQMIGRGLRIYPGKLNCKIIDLVDNHKSLSNFNCILDGEFYEPINSFKSSKDISDHIEKEIIKFAEITLQKTNLLNTSGIEDLEPTESMIDYLKKNKVIFFEPLSFNEASFLIWMNELKNELKKEFENGND